MSKSNFGKLYLIPSAIGNEDKQREVMPQTAQLLPTIKHFVVESEKQARRFLKWVNRDINIDELTFYSMGKHSDSLQSESWMVAAKNGMDVGVISDAGCPGVADPGSTTVAQAHENQIEVVPLVGPSSILLALMSSGFNGQHFTFSGYLPHDSKQRKSALLSMEALAKKGQTQIFMETPYRNTKLLTELCQTLSAGTGLAIASGLLSGVQRITMKSIGDWQKRIPNLDKEPCIFLLGNK